MSQPEPEPPPIVLSITPTPTELERAVITAAVTAVACEPHHPDPVPDAQSVRRSHWEIAGVREAIAARDWPPRARAAKGG